jgi:hypothetical protein
VGQCENITPHVVFDDPIETAQGRLVDDVVPSLADAPVPGGVPDCVLGDGRYDSVPRVW